MTGAQRLSKAFELGDTARRVLESGLRARYPDVSEAEFRELLRARLERCHNRNY